MSDETLADAELVRLAAAGGQGRRTAERALVRRYAARVQRYAERHLSDARAAEDLAQLSFLAVLEALRAGRIADPERLGAFVLSTCRHLVWDENRARSRQRRLEQSLGADEPVVEPPTTTALDRARLERCVRELAEREQRVVMLTYCEDWSSERIAAELQTSAGNVRVLRHRALARLGSCIERSGQGADA